MERYYASYLVVHRMLSKIFLNAKECSINAKRMFNQSVQDNVFKKIPKNNTTESNYRKMCSITIECKDSFNRVLNKGLPNANQQDFKINVVLKIKQECSTTGSTLTK